MLNKEGSLKNASYGNWLKKSLGKVDLFETGNMRPIQFLKIDIVSGPSRPLGNHSGMVFIWRTSTWALSLDCYPSGQLLCLCGHFYQPKRKCWGYLEMPWSLIFCFETW